MFGVSSSQQVPREMETVLVSSPVLYSRALLVLLPCSVGSGSENASTDPSSSVPRTRRVTSGMYSSFCMTLCITVCLCIVDLI